MNTTEYISSGILEAYVLGSVSPQERQEVECISKIYPEVKAELTALQDTMDTYVTTYDKAPPKHLKDKIFAQMTFADEEETEQEVQAIADEPTLDAAPKRDTLPLWPKLSIAASLLLGAMFAWSWNQNNSLKNEMAQMKGQMETVAEQNQKSEGLLALFTDNENQKVVMKGVEKSPESEVTVFWNKNTSEVKLLVQNLPAAPTGKQYQLWTIVDGVPVDMGMLDNDFREKVISMKTAKGNVAAFAITLEKQGGSPSPTLEEMYVLGNV